MEAKRLATYDDLLALPPNVVGEIIHGSLYTHARPTPRHAVAASRLGADVSSLFDRGRGGPGGWLSLDKPELALDGHVLVPDIAGWKRETLPALPTTNWFDTCPDWLCEVLSPSTQRYDRLVKLEVYFEVGVRWAWIVDPVEQFIEVYHGGDQGWARVATASDESGALLPPFQAVPLDIGSLWEL